MTTTALGASALQIAGVVSLVAAGLGFAYSQFVSGKSKNKTENLEYLIKLGEANASEIERLRRQQQEQDREIGRLNGIIQEKEKEIQRLKDLLQGRDPAFSEFMGFMKKKADEDSKILNEIKGFMGKISQNLNKN